MSTQLEDAVEDISQRLETAGLKWWGFSLGTGIAVAAFVSVATLSLFVLADALLTFSQAILAVLSTIWAILTLGLSAGVIARYGRGPRQLPATARRVELEFPEAGSHLINMVQFAASDEDNDGFRRAAMAQAAATVEDIPFEQAARRESRRRRFRLVLNTPRDFVESCLALIGLVALAFVLTEVIPTWSSSFQRLLQPWAFVPSLGRVHIVKVTPGDTEVLVGVGVDITAEIDNPEKTIYPGRVHVQTQGEPDMTLDMQADAGNRRYTANVPKVTVPLRYRLEIGDSQTRFYTLGVCQKPSIAEVEVTYQYPDYLGRAAEKVAQKHGDLEAPQFTSTSLSIRPLTPIARGYLLVDGQNVNGYVSEDGRTMRAYLLLTKDTTYTVHAFTQAGQTDAEPRVNRIRVLPDAPPTVSLLQPAGESAMAIGKMMSVVIRAGDDHGLGLVRLEMKRGAKVETVVSWDKVAGSTEVVLNHQLLLDKKRFQAGEVVLLRALARDQRQLDVDHGGEKLTLLPQDGATPWHKIGLISPEAKSAADLARLETLRAALMKILFQQIEARVAAAKVAHEKTLDSARTLIAAVQEKQTRIQKDTLGLVASIGPAADPELRVLKRAANKLGLGDMVEAVKQADVLARLPQLDALGKPLGVLTATQDRIIDVLRRLLNEVRKENAQLLAEMEKKPSTELPADVQNKLRELNDKLQEFLKQQKKVIEATESLAKKPVEDFSDKDEQKLKDLAALEDDWSRFLADRHSDFSKLPEQDFSNPSFLDELIEVQTELKMAKDALTKKAADIAVPLEQLGAEMAKELTANIEKWLPDTPDRERWSQEEPLTDAMKEAPMAELPKELEDLVGKLMEQEEDLFDELEDRSSSWADSIDKGAGWDAADGPISNMSAKGVTGNRLPNTNEIGGRSGEGRQGQASGEFVGTSAVGKGGRKTPSRLGPEPHVKGQIKDTSKDPVGGATGGGKESGQGGEGLQGPVPNRPERELGRLANKQAELRNKAEAVDLRFKVLRYHHADLKKLIETMAVVESDLRGGKYQNALRRREVLLQGLAQLRAHLKGEFAISKDTTSNLPTNIQREILGSMQEPSPLGWEELNRRYFEQLGKTPASSGKTSPSAAPK
jgi:hypothetical protein